MSVRQFFCVAALLCPLVLATTPLASASDRDSGPAGAAGFGRPASAYNPFDPHSNPTRNVSGNREFREPKHTVPAVSAGHETAPPYEPVQTPAMQESDDSRGN